MSLGTRHREAVLRLVIPVAVGGLVAACGEMTFDLGSAPSRVERPSRATTATSEETPPASGRPASLPRSATSSVLSVPELARMIADPKAPSGALDAKHDPFRKADPFRVLNTFDIRGFRLRMTETEILAQLSELGGRETNRSGDDCTGEFIRSVADRSLPGVEKINDSGARLRPWESETCPRMLNAELPDGSKLFFAFDVECWLPSLRRTAVRISYTPASLTDGQARSLAWPALRAGVLEKFGPADRDESRELEWLDPVVPADRPQPMATLEVDDSGLRLERAEFELLCRAVTEHLSEQILLEQRPEITERPQI